MRTIEHLEANAPSRWEAQAFLAQRFDAFLDDGAEVGCFEAATGIGKTLAMSSLCAAAADQGKRVILSAHTVVQCRQAVAALEIIGVAHQLHLGRANYFSPDRIKRLLANSEPGDPANPILRLALDFDGPIDDFETMHGPLPVARADVCLTSGCLDQGAYTAARKGDAPVIVQTHASTLLAIYRGDLDADLLVFDEADALPAVAEGFAEVRVTGPDLLALADRFQLPDLAEAVTGLAEAAESAPAWRAHRPLVEATRDALAEVDHDAARDVRRAMVKWLGDDGTNPHRGAAIYKDRGRLVLTLVADSPGRTWRRAVEGRKAAFVSATLCARRSGDFDGFLRRVGCERLTLSRASDAVSPESFGTLDFVLADRDAPLPFDDRGERVTAYDDHAATIVEAARERGGRVLVLVPSFEDVGALVERMPDIIAHHRGDKLGPLLDRFRNSLDGVLATPAAWAGVDLPGVIDQLVIWRLPFPPANPARANLLRGLFASRGYPEAAADRVLWATSRDDLKRKLAQGLGRPIRQPEDHATVWIADPRFPLPGVVVQDLRKLLHQGPAKGNEDLAEAIPARFMSAYEAAKIEPLATVLEVSA